MERNFEKAGFDLHEKTGVELSAKVLSFEIHTGKRGCVRPLPERLWKVRGALLWAASGVKLSGVQVSKMVGVYIFMATLLRPGRPPWPRSH